MTDNERLLLAEERAVKSFPDGIGTQSEKLVHSTVKYFLEPDESCHEVRVGRFIADIFQKERGHIYEVQTRQFGRLVPKLDSFLNDYRVTVVYPVVRHKYLHWVDPETGEISKSRRSPKAGRASDILPEMYALKDLITRENLDFLVLLFDAEEYRLLDGYSRDKKHGSHRMERKPLAYGSEASLSSPNDFRGLIPEDLAEPFFRAELEKALHLQGRKGSYAVEVLKRVGAIEKIGEIDRKHIYVRK